RALTVTGVQTCALPIYGERQTEQLRRRRLEVVEHAAAELDLHALDARRLGLDLVAELGGVVEADVVGDLDGGVGDGAVARDQARSEERRVGKGCLRGRG